MSVTLSQATTIVPGDEINGTLTPSRESDLYRFDAVAGERFYFDAQRVTGGVSGVTARVSSNHR